MESYRLEKPTTSPSPGLFFVPFHHHLLHPSPSTLTVFSPRDLLDLLFILPNKQSEIITYNIISTLYLLSSDQSISVPLVDFKIATMSNFVAKAALFTILAAPAAAGPVEKRLPDCFVSVLFPLAYIPKCHTDDNDHAVDLQRQ